MHAMQTLRQYLGKLKHYCCFQMPLRLLHWLGFLIARRSDYYSPLPDRYNLASNRQRWDKPSALRGVQFDLEEMEKHFEETLISYLSEAPNLYDHAKLKTSGFGPGIPWLDAVTLYGMIRHHKPSRILEIGSGLSTYYACLAVRANSENYNLSTNLCCIEPNPYPQLLELGGIELQQTELQNVPLDFFDVLQSGDILFVDSSHILKIDGDVARIVLEILPRLPPGVYVHIHDVHFPYNTPHPADYWVLKPQWPMFWNEAMVIQSFLAFNSAFQTYLSAPLLRHYRPQLLENKIPLYQAVADDPNQFSSLWIKRER
jgi:hypothetical protein